MKAQSAWSKNDFLENMDAEHMIARALMELRAIKPFYASMLEVVERICDNSAVDTIGVNPNTLVYNSDFIESLSYAEFMFIIMHELSHLMLQHTARAEKRDANLWNVACDYYVNKLLCEELGIDPLGLRTASIGAIQVCLPNDGMFCSSINTDTDTAESLYEELEKQADKNGYNASIAGRFEFNIGKSGAGSKITDAKDGHCAIDKSANFGDLLKGSGSSEIDKMASRKTVEDAIARSEMSSKGHGEGDAKIAELVKKMLKSYINWRVLLKRHLVASKSKDSSFSSPDKRMSYQPAIYPGSGASELNKLKDVKVCVDVSGSISKDDLGYFFGQVNSLLEKFKTEAELIYWDFSVTSCGNFSSYKEFMDIPCLGMGGTDPTCVFEYLSSKKCKVKPLVTLVFTDGYFDTEGIDKSTFKRKFKDTIWVMTRDRAISFVPPFGTIALAEFDKGSNK